jgi:hypothetical protein
MNLVIGSQVSITAAGNPLDHEQTVVIDEFRRRRHARGKLTSLKIIVETFFHERQIADLLQPYVHLDQIRPLQPHFSQSPPQGLEAIFKLSREVVPEPAVQPEVDGVSGNDRPGITVGRWNSADAGHGPAPSAIRRQSSD